MLTAVAQTEAGHFGYCPICGALIVMGARAGVVGRSTRVGHLALEVLQLLLGTRPHRTALRRSSIPVCGR